MAHTSQNSIEYFHNREQREISLAEAATSPTIKAIHLEMAARYRKFIDLRQGQPNQAEIHNA